MNRGLATTRWRNRLVVAILLTIGSLAALVTWNLRGRPDPRLEAIRGRGYPVNLAELDAWYKPVPSAENAALILTNVFAQPLFVRELSATTNMGTTNWWPPRGRLLTENYRRELAALSAEGLR